MLTLLQLLHVCAAALLLAAAVACLARPDAKPPQRLVAFAAALLAAGVMPLAGEAGRWIDMPADEMVPALALLALGLAAAGSRSMVGRPATFALAGFFAVLGATSLRHGGPLPAFMAAKAGLLGLSLGLLPWTGALRLRMALLILVLVASVGIGLHKDLPFA